MYQRSEYKELGIHGPSNPLMEGHFEPMASSLTKMLSHAWLAVARRVCLTEPQTGPDRIEGLL